MPWYSLKKGTSSVEISYAHGSVTLLVKNVEMRPADPFDISIDLDSNLHTRNKQENMYGDAQDVSKEISSLKSVEVRDRTVIQGIAKQFGRVKPQAARLRVLLDGEHCFFISMESRGDDLLVLTTKSTTECD